MTNQEEIKFFHIPIPPTKTGFRRDTEMVVIQLYRIKVLKYVSDSFEEKYQQLLAEGYGDEENKAWGTCYTFYDY